MSKRYTYYVKYESRVTEVFPVSNGFVELEIGNSRVHNFAGMVFFNDAQGDVFVTPTAGTATFTVKLVVQPQAFQEITNNVLDITMPCQVNWAANTLVVRADLTDIVGATHARLIWAGNSA